MQHLGGSRLLAIGAVVGLLGCQTVAPSPSVTRSATSRVEAPAETSSPVAAAPSTTPAPTDQSLANPGGTCTAAQLVSGEATVEGEPSTIVSQHVLVFAQVRNSGAACILAQPKEIGLASATGAFVAYSAPNLGQVVYVGNAGHYEYPDSYSVQAGQSIQIDINAYWWIDYAASPTRPPNYPCGAALSGIARADIPLASGVLQMVWHPPFGEVCTTPPSVSIGFELK